MKLRVVGDARDSFTFHSYDYFALGMTFSKIPERVTSLVQGVASVDDWYDLSSLEQVS